MFHLKVSWNKIKQRVKCYLGNIFSLRYFWRHLFPNRPLRFISFDKQPSWFNNVAGTGTCARKGGSQPIVKELHHKSCQRYTICTCVDSHAPGHQPPHVVILFKGAKNGPIINKIKELYECPPWVHLQLQKFGSYRAEDMIELLRMTLPVATTHEDSCIVPLDWFAAHRDERVIQAILDLSLIHISEPTRPY